MEVSQVLQMVSDKHIRPSIRAEPVLVGFKPMKHNIKAIKIRKERTASGMGGLLEYIRWFSWSGSTN